MDYIIFDLEWNQPYSNDISFLKRAKMPLTGEIIQIGAVKLNSDLEIVDKFSMLVKPKYLKYMHKHVSELT
ncbi:MAG: exonuclease, partial [Veillonella sp.]|nr:exonuclease [Veillonella sp.]